MAAYLIVVEAVTNAHRHSGAETCAVRLRRDPDALRITISDTGRGLAATRTPGVGLSSMAERAEELGGACTVRSTEGSGAVVDVVLPLGEPGSEG